MLKHLVFLVEQLYTIHLELTQVNYLLNEQIQEILFHSSILL